MTAEEKIATHRLSVLQLAEVFRKKLYSSAGTLKKDLDAWLRFYNNERPHQGYRNMGRGPIETINSNLKNVQKLA